MYLRDVMVLPAEPSKETTIRLRKSSDHVLDILRHHLPPEYELNCLRRVVVDLGSKKAPDQYAYRDSGLGVGLYALPNFDLERYFALPLEEQEEEILHCAEKSLVDLALRFGTDLRPLRLAALQVKHSHFRLELELKCSKTHPSRKLRVRIIKRFAPGGVFVRSEMRNKTGDLLSSSELFSSGWVVTADHRFHNSRWKGNTLEIKDGSGTTTAEVPCDPYLVP